MSYTNKTNSNSQTLATTYTGTWASLPMNVLDKSVLSLALNIDYKATSIVVTIKIQALCNNVWYDVYKDVSGTLALNEAATPSLTADAKIMVPFDVQHYETVRVLAKCSDITGTPTLSVYALNEYAPVYKNEQNNAQTAI